MNYDDEKGDCGIHDRNKARKETFKGKEVATNVSLSSRAVLSTPMRKERVDVED